MSASDRCLLRELTLASSSLQHVCPEGIYITLSPEDPSVWAGVLFVRSGKRWKKSLGQEACLSRSGPYESAILRFQIIFPTAYPQSAPVITFSSELFHPLVVPLTQYTFSAGALDSTGTVSASDTDRLPPGSFSLRHGFPQWFKHGGSARSSLESQSEIEISGGSAGSPSQKHEHQAQDVYDSRSTTLHVLEHLKQSFEDAEFLDNLPFTAVGNPSAWHAWRAHRGLGQSQARGRKPAADEKAKKSPSSPKQMSEWNWDGVWESRVRNGIEMSVGEGALYGSQGLVRFSKLDDDQLRDARQQLQAT